jgi:hypothetical protein
MSLNKGIYRTCTVYRTIPLVNTGEADLRDVCRELVSIKAKYYQLGVELGLPPQELDAIRKEDPQDVDQVFTKVILRWLRQEYNIWYSYLAGTG